MVAGSVRIPTTHLEGIFKQTARFDKYKFFCSSNFMSYGNHHEYRQAHMCPSAGRRKMSGAPAGPMARAGDGSGVEGQSTKYIRSLRRLYSTSVSLAGTEQKRRQVVLMASSSLGLTRPVPLMHRDVTFEHLDGAGLSDFFPGKSCASLHH